jgi:hypothetical protein
LLGTADGVLLDVVADLVYDTADGPVLVAYDLEDSAALQGYPTSTPPLALRQRAGLLALAFQAATGRVAQAVEVVQATADGSTSRFEDVPGLIEEARLVLTHGE